LDDSTADLIASVTTPSRWSISWSETRHPPGPGFTRRGLGGRPASCLANGEGLLQGGFFQPALGAGQRHPRNQATTRSMLRSGILLLASWSTHLPAKYRNLPPLLVVLEGACSCRYSA